MSLELNSIHLGDCLELMNQVDDESIQLIVCDPPYGTTEANWDKQLPFNELWKAFNRILKPNGTAILTASQPFTTYLINSNLKQFKYCLVWCKTRSTGWLHAKNKPMKMHEDVVVFSKGTTVHAEQSDNRMVYNPQMEQGHTPYTRLQQNRRGTVWGGTGRKEEKPQLAENQGERYPTSVLHIATSNYKSLHPTQKPVELIEWLVLSYSNEGDTVLDPCIGSGTTAVACAHTGRNFIGIDIDPKYVNISQQRACKRRKKKSQ